MKTCVGGPCNSQDLRLKRLGLHLKVPAPEPTCPGSERGPPCQLPGSRFPFAGHTPPSNPELGLALQERRWP